MEKRYVRSFGKILWLTFITLGIYWWVYLFKTLTHLEEKLSFNVDEIGPKNLRPFFRNLVISYYIVPIVCLFMLSPQIMKELQYSAAISENPCLKWLVEFPFPSIGARMIINTMIFAVTAIGITICVFFVNLISLSQKKAGMVPFEKAPVWALLAVNAVLGVIQEASGAVLMASLTSSFIVWYIVVKQINRIWLYNTTVIVIPK